MLEWEGTYGYGDIVNATAQAMWRYNKYNDRELQFFWYKDRKWYPPDQLYHPNDDDTILNRVDQIIDQFVGTDILNVTHVDAEFTEKDERLRRKWSKRWRVSTWWTDVWDTKIIPSEGDKIVVWSPLNNKDNLNAEFGTDWKSPLSPDDWKRLYDVLGDRMEFIDYRMPVSQVFEKISKAKMCIGYEGIGQTISKNFFKPIITFSRDHWLDIQTVTTNAGPWGACYKNSNHLDSIDKIYKIANEQKDNIEWAKKRFEQCKLTEL